MEKQLRILILEDSADDVELIEHQLKKGDFSFISKVVETRDGYEKALSEFRPDIILSDHSLPMFDSMLALQMFHSYRKIYNSAAAFILVTGTVSEEFAVKIMKEGADDYILKDRLKRLPAAVKNARDKNQHKDQRRKEEEEKLYMYDILQRSLHEIYVINPDSLKYEYVNEEVLKNLGYSLKEMMKLTPADTIKDFSGLGLQDILKYTEQRKKGLIIERTNLRKDRSTYPVQIHLQVIQQGGKKKILANMLDITEAKELEKQKELSTFIQNSFNHTLNLQESLEIILEKFCESCSCIAAEIYSREFDLPDPKLQASFNSFKKSGTISGSKMAEKVFESESMYSSTADWQNEQEKDCTNNASVESAVAIPIKSGTKLEAVLIGYMDQEIPEENKFSVFSEQVQHKLAENINRKKSEEELQKIFEFSPDILTVLGKDGYVRKINPALQRILGYSPEEMLTMNFAELIHPEDLSVLKEWRETELKENEVAHYESRWRASNGKYKCFSWSVTPYMKGELHFAVGRDITEYKKHLNAIQEQNKKLGEIAWTQSHEVRGPLTRLLACVEFLKENEEPPANLLSSVKSSAYEIDSIIKRIICMSEKVELDGEG